MLYLSVDSGSPSKSKDISSYIRADSEAAASSSFE